ncbi:MAG: ScyD/ScyE family protein [Anaerolineae bacterium]|nr:ScyD/ScyE family protein [Anaerolineae bacterium]
MRFLYLTMALLVLIAPTLAQETPEVLVDGLANPRNMAFDSEGSLYIADAGLAGELTTRDGDAFGATGQIVKVSPDGSQEVVAKGFISFREGDTLGPSAIQVTEESIWVLLGESADFTIPFTHALVELDKETGRVKNFVDLLTVELEQDPDGNPNQQSNPTDFAVAPDGTVYIANAGCNCLLSWTPDSGVQVAASWPYDTDNPVPTSIEIAANGDMYVGFLTGFPFPPGGSRIERWSNGALAETFSGLTMVTGLLLAGDGSVYAVEHSTAFDPAAGFGPGRVVMVSADGITPVAENLISPYGIAQAPDGRIVVSVGSTGGADGQVVVIQ